MVCVGPCTIGLVWRSTGASISAHTSGFLSLLCNGHLQCSMFVYCVYCIMLVMGCSIELTLTKGSDFFFIAHDEMAWGGYG